jgi:hypothetical protein
MMYKETAYIQLLGQFGQRQLLRGVEALGDEQL